MKVRCSNQECRAVLQLSEKAAGKRIKCPKCGAVSRIPGSKKADSEQARSTPEDKPSRHPALRSLEMKQCEACGTSVEKDAHTCMECGHIIGTPVQAPKNIKKKLIIGAGAFLVIVAVSAAFFIFRQDDAPPASPDDRPAQAEKQAVPPSGDPEQQTADPDLRLDHPGRVKHFDSPMDFLPADSGLVLSIDINRLIEYPLFREIRDDAEEDFREIIDENLDQYGLQLDDVIPEKVFLFAQINAENIEETVVGTVIRTGMNEVRLTEVLADAGKKFGIDYSKERIHDYDVHLLPGYATSPILARGEEQKKRAASRSHLKQIGLAMNMYIHEHGNWLPESLGELEEFVDNFDIFKSPLDPRPAPISRAHEIDNLSSYIFNPNVAGESHDNISRDTPLVIERPEHFDGQSTIMLFADFSVRDIEEDRFFDALDEMGIDPPDIAEDEDPLPDGKTALTYLDPEHVLLIDRDHFDSVTRQIGEGRTLASSAPAGLENVDQEALLWFFFDADIAVPEHQKVHSSPSASAWVLEAQDSIDNVVEGAFSLDLTGPGQRDILIKIMSRLKSEEDAQDVYDELQEGLGMLPMAFMDNPELGRRITESVDIDLDDTVLRVNVSLEEEVVEELHQFAQKATETMGARGDPRGGEVLSVLHSIRSAQETYYTENGYYADDIAKLGLSRADFRPMQHVSLDEFSITHGNADGFVARWSGMFEIRGTRQVFIDHNGQIHYGADSDPTPEPEPIIPAEIRRFEGHMRNVESVVFSPCGQKALSASSDSTLILWDVETGEELLRMTGHRSFVETVAFLPDKEMALSGSADRTLRLWDLDSGEEIRTFTGHDRGVKSVAVSPDGKMAASGSAAGIGRDAESQVLLWNVESGEAVRTLMVHGSDINCVAFSPDGENVLVGANSGDIMGPGVVKLIDVSTGKTVLQPEAHEEDVNCVAFSRDGRRIVSGSDFDVGVDDPLIKIWDAETGEMMHGFRGHSDDVLGVTFSPCGERVLSASADGTLKLWELDSENGERTFEGHTDFVNHVTFSPDGEKALSASQDRTVILWLLEGTTLAEMPDERPSVAMEEDDEWEITDGYSLFDIIQTLEDEGFFISGRGHEVDDPMLKGNWGIEWAREFNVVAEEALEVNGKNICLYEFDPSAENTPRNMKDMLQFIRRRGRMEMEMEMDIDKVEMGRHQNILFFMEDHPESEAISRVIREL